MLYARHAILINVVVFCTSKQLVYAYLWNMQRPSDQTLFKYSIAAFSYRF